MGSYLFVGTKDHLVITFDFRDQSIVTLQQKSQKTVKLFTSLSIPPMFCFHYFPSQKLYIFLAISDEAPNEKKASSYHKVTKFLFSCKSDFPEKKTQLQSRKKVPSAKLP